MCQGANNSVKDVWRVFLFIVWQECARGEVNNIPVQTMLSAICNRSTEATNAGLISLQQQMIVHLAKVWLCSGLQFWDLRCQFDSTVCSVLVNFEFLLPGCAVVC